MEIGQRRHFRVKHIGPVRSDKYAPLFRGSVYDVCGQICPHTCGHTHDVRCGSGNARSLGTTGGPIWIIQALPTVELSIRSHWPIVQMAESEFHHVLYECATTPHSGNLLVTSGCSSLGARNVWRA